MVRHYSFPAGKASFRDFHLVTALALNHNKINAIEVTRATTKQTMQMKLLENVSKDSHSNTGRTIGQKMNVVGGLSGIVAVVVNLFYGFGNFLSGCDESIHSTCATSMKLNWIDFFRMDEHIAWSPTGEIGIPDILILVVCLWALITGLRSKN